MPKAPRTHRHPHSQHSKQEQRRRYDQRRGSAAERGYDGDWQKLSEAFVAEQLAIGNCRCAECGKLLAGDRKDIHVDHKVPFCGKDDQLRLDWGNLQCLHATCHSVKTGRDKAAGMTRKGIR